MASAGNVLILDENLSVPFDRRVWMEATTLAAAGYDVTVVCQKMRPDEADHEVLEGVHIHRHPVLPDGDSPLGYVREYGLALYHETRLAWRLSRGRRFDVVHLCNPPDLLFLVGWVLRLTQGTKMIFDQHDLAPELYETKYGRRDVLYHALRLLERLTFLSADTVIVTNESYRDVALARHAKRADRIFVVRSGPDLDRYLATPANPAFRPRRYLVGYVGVMGPQEGIDYLLRAVHHLVHEEGRDDIQFMLVGGGASLDEMRAYSRSLGLEDHVEFTGRIPEAELLERLSSTDLCVNPDPKNPLNDVSTMNKILEYMALAKPIVQFDLREGRRSAEGASVYARANDEKDLARQIATLLDDPARREEMGRIGRHRMETRLEWKHQAPELLRAYATTVGEDRPARRQEGEGSAASGGASGEVQ